MNVLLIVGKVLNVLCKFSYNAWEGTVTLFFNEKSIQKWRNCSVFFRIAAFSTSADPVWFVKIVEECVAADIEDE